MPALSLLSSPSFAPLHYPRYRSLAERSSMASCVWTHLQQPGCRRWVTINTYRDSRVRVSRDVINVQPRLRGVVLDIVSRYLHTRVRQREHADRHDTHCHARARLCWTCHAFFSLLRTFAGVKCFFFSPFVYISLLLVRPGRDGESLKVPSTDIWGTFPFFQHISCSLWKRILYESNCETNW